MFLLAFSFVNFETTRGNTGKANISFLSLLTTLPKKLLLNFQHSQMKKRGETLFGECILYLFQKPQNCLQVLIRRLLVFKRDLAENWFFCTCQNREDTIKKKRMEAMLEKQRQMSTYLLADSGHHVPRRLSNSGSVIHSGAGQQAIVGGRIHSGSGTGGLIQRGSGDRGTGGDLGINAGHGNTAIIGSNVVGGYPGLAFHNGQLGTSVNAGYGVNPGGVQNPVYASTEGLDHIRTPHVVSNMAMTDSSMLHSHSGTQNSQIYMRPPVIPSQNSHISSNGPIANQNMHPELNLHDRRQIENMNQNKSGTPSSQIYMRPTVIPSHNSHIANNGPIANQNMHSGRSQNENSNQNNYEGRIDIAANPPDYARLNESPKPLYSVPNQSDAKMSGDNAIQSVSPQSDCKNPGPANVQSDQEPESSHVESQNEESTHNNINDIASPVQDEENTNLTGSHDTEPNELGYENQGFSNQ